MVLPRVLLLRPAGDQPGHPPVSQALRDGQDAHRWRETPCKSSEAGRKSQTDWTSLHTFLKRKRVPPPDVAGDGCIFTRIVAAFFSRGFDPRHSADAPEQCVPRTSKGLAETPSAACTAHPAAKLERENRQLFARIWAELGLGCHDRRAYGLVRPDAGASLLTETLSMPFADPDRARNYQRDYRRLRRGGAGCTTPGTTPVPLSFRLQTAADVLDLLEEQVEAVRQDPEAGTLEKARTIGFLAGISLKAIEAGNVAARLEALEAVLKKRNGKAET